jgi:hypothetical protein
LALAGQSDVADSEEKNAMSTIADSKTKHEAACTVYEAAPGRLNLLQKKGAFARCEGGDILLGNDFLMVRIPADRPSSDPTAALERQRAPKALSPPRAPRIIARGCQWPPPDSQLRRSHQMPASQPLSRFRRKIGKSRWAALIGRLNEVNRDIRRRGIKSFHNHIDLLTGYSYGEFYDWDLYFENLYMSYFGISRYCRNNLETFLDRQHPSGYVPRTLTDPRQRQHFKPFLAQIVVLGCRQSGDWRWVAGKYYQRLAKYLDYWFWYGDFDKNGLVRHGRRNLAQELAYRTFELVISEADTREYYDGETGAGQGLNPFWGWSALAYLLPLELELGYDPTDLETKIRPIAKELLGVDFPE